MKTLNLKQVIIFNVAIIFLAICIILFISYLFGINIIGPLIAELIIFILWICSFFGVRIYLLDSIINFIDCVFNFYNVWENDIKYTVHVIHKHQLWYYKKNGVFMVSRMNGPAYIKKYESCVNAKKYEYWLDGKYYPEINSAEDLLIKNIIE